MLIRRISADFAIVPNVKEHWIVTKESSAQIFSALEEDSQRVNRASVGNAIVLMEV